MKPALQKTRNSKPPKVILQDGTIGQIVHKIINHRKRKNKLEYQIQWEGKDDPTWEPEENLKQVEGLIKDYKNQKTKKRRIKQ